MFIKGANTAVGRKGAFAPISELKHFCNVRHASPVKDLTKINVEGLLGACKNMKILKICNKGVTIKEIQFLARGT